MNANSDPQAAELAFTTEWAKLGIPAASNKQAYHCSKAELLEERANLRKGINAIASRA